MPPPQEKPPAGRMPVLFVGHGSPAHAFGDNRWSRGFARLGRSIPRPRAILAISAHWYVAGSWVTADREPQTIHDFHGFPEHMYAARYPAPGDPELARRVRGLLADDGAELRSDWGLDHGTWTVLRHAYPDASVPVVQLSVDRRLSPARIHRLAGALGELRHDGVLIFASGNITHNLADAVQRMGRAAPETPAWASRFDGTVARLLEDHDGERLARLWPDGEDARLVHPSPDHWLPLIYAHGATDRDDSVSFPVTGFDAGSLSMRSVLFG